MVEKARLIRCDDLLEADVDGEIVALHIEKGQCYGLNAVASLIWGMLAAPISLDEICTALLRDYDVDPETCRADVGTLLEELRAEGLVRPLPE